MSRRRTPASRTDLVDGRATLFVPIEALIDANGDAVQFKGLSRWFSKVRDLGDPLSDAPASVALVVDAFAFDLNVGDLAYATNTHDGEAFRDAAVEHGAAVYVVTDIDPRRSSHEARAEAAANGQVLGARVAAFAVDRLPDEHG